MYKKNFSISFICSAITYGKEESSMRPGSSSENPPLTPIGLFQAEKLAKSHMTDGADVLFASTLLSAVETVYPTALKLNKKVILLPDLMEEGTVSQGTEEAEIKKRFPLAVYPEGSTSPAGGSLMLGEEDVKMKFQRAERCLDFFSGYAKENDNLIVVSHRKFMNRLLRVSLGIKKGTFVFKNDDCSIAKVVFRGEKIPELAFSNYTGHLFE